MVTIKETVIQAIRTYLKAHSASSALTNAQVIPADDKGPRPALPYMTVSVGANSKVGTDEICDIVVATVPYKYARSQRTITVTVDGFGLGSEDWLETSSIGFNLPNQQKTLRDLDLTARPNGDIIDLSSMRDTAIEYHFSQDWTVDLCWTSANQEQVEVLTFETEITADDLVVDVTTTP